MPVTTAAGQADAASSSSGRGAAELRNPGYEIFIAALSILSILNLVLLIVVNDPALQSVLTVMNAILSLILFIDFCVRFRSAESRTGYFFRNFGWADLLASLPFPQLKVLRFFRLGRVYRLLKDYGVRKIGRSLLKERAGSALLTLLFVAILVLEFGSLWMLRLESKSPDANITTASDAIWYVIVTISTVGYGDQYPVTNPGRILGAVIIVLGVAIFGTLTGYLANLFLSPGTPDMGEVEPTVGTAESSHEDLHIDPLDVRLARLTKAGQLRDAGILSAQEFESTKVDILATT